MKAKLTLAVLISTVSLTAQAQSYSSTFCRAYTQCLISDMYGRTFPNGFIACEVYGAAYTNYAGGNTSQCNWFVQPYRFVSCQGFAKSFDYYGNMVWGWQNYYYRCPGM